MIDLDTRARAQADVIARNRAILLPDKNTVVCPAQLPLPGVVILVHGVNSDGEWYEATEQGLCAGLNARLARNPEQMAIKGVAGGQLTPATYISELTDSGFLNPERTAQTFIDADTENYSPVIRFRWGYKADRKSQKEFGDGVWLNEASYWGGGPFANGCTALPDLWEGGLDDRLFLWITAQHLNPAVGRDVYACPPRHYYALAGKRLAELVKLIRSKQADVPITIVCHSQGNMIGLAAAFYGAGEAPVTDAKGCTGRAVADTYVLANPPYSLVEKIGSDNWTQRDVTNERGESGRQTGAARRQTLANFLDLVRAQRGLDQAADEIERWSANACPLDGSTGYTVAGEREKDYARKGRVTLYCNPHDRVISALTVQGIGWRGLDAGEIRDVKGDGVFVQRVWAQDHPVGRPGDYTYWDGRSEFWQPASPPARFSLAQGLEANQNAIARVLTFLTAPITWFIVKIAGAAGLTRINAMPPAGRRVPVNAPELPEHLPQAQRFGQTTAFDQTIDPDADARNAQKEAERKRADDPYDSYAPNEAKGEGAAQGDRDSEARLRYEHRARLRMKDRRRGGDGTDADRPDDQASPEWRTWSNEQITHFLRESVDQEATDHSTIMTCAANLEKVLAYDVSVGLSRISDADWNEFRIAADWQLGLGLKKDNPLKKFGHYFETGLWQHGETDKRLHEHPDFLPKAKPDGIVDQRSNPPAHHRSGETS